MVGIACDRFTSERQNLGWMSQRQYQGDSWLFKRYQATQFSECDYRSRAVAGTIFAQSNLSLAAPKSMMEMHLDKMVDDLLPSEKFFGVMPDGPEDVNPALDPAERYLQARSKRAKLLNKFKDSLRGCLTRGESVYKATKATIIKHVPVNARLVLDANGKPAKDSLGDFITESDIWKQKADAIAGVMFLERDPKTVLTLPSGVALPLSEETKVFVRPELALDGCDWDLPYWSDIVIPDTAKSLDATDFRAHIFDAYPEDVINGLPQDRLNKGAVDSYLEQYANNGVGTASLSDAAAPADNRGEKQPLVDTSQDTPQKRTYVEMWWRWDADEDRKSEDLMLLVDLEAQWPIAYDYAALVLDYSENKIHPFGLNRIYPVESRWYGRGYWDEMADMNYFIDWCWNNLKIDLANSGNMLFGNPQATEEGVAGVPYKFRSSRLYRSRGQFTPADAMHVVTVPSQAGPIQDSMNTMLQRIQGLGGSVASGETPVPGLPGRDTATAANIAKSQSDIMVRARETEFVLGMNDALRIFADIELGDFDFAFAKKLLGEPAALDLQTWLESEPGAYRDHIEVSMTKTRSTDLIETSMAKIDLTDRWDATLPENRTKARQRFYADILKAMGDQDPEGALPLPILPTMPPGVGPDGLPLPVDPALAPEVVDAAPVDPMLTAPPVEELQAAA